MTNEATKTPETTQKAVESMPLLDCEIERLNQAVDDFAIVMKAKLAKKAKEGLGGWDRPAFDSMIASVLMHKANLVEYDRTQAVDVANFAMMLWFQNENN